MNKSEFTELQESTAIDVFLIKEEIESGFDVEINNLLLDLIMKRYKRVRKSFNLQKPIQS